MLCYLFRNGEDGPYLSPQQGNEVTLKMLADDRYCGRIIGKEGKVIKKIREDTDTRITVSK